MSVFARFSCVLKDATEPPFRTLLWVRRIAAGEAFQLDLFAMIRPHNISRNQHCLSECPQSQATISDNRRFPVGRHSIYRRNGIALGVRARSAANRNAELHAQQRTRNPVQASNPHSQPRETRAFFGVSSLCIDRINVKFERMDLLERISQRGTSSKYNALSVTAYL
jgi:hypothetical protein